MNTVILSGDACQSAFDLTYWSIFLAFVGDCRTSLEYCLYWVFSLYNFLLKPLFKSRAVPLESFLIWCMLSFSNTEVGDSYGVVGVAFSGPQLQSATVLLDQDVIDERTVEAAMQRLKAANIPEHNTIGFMFACVGRGYQHYKTKRNLEADAFRKLFPNVPLFGFFGHGEIGCDRIVTGNFILRECNDVKDDLLHGYTTVMTLIHLGSTKANQV